MRSEIRVPAAGIRCWLTKRLVASGDRVESGQPICRFDIATGAFSSGPDVDVDLEAPAAGRVEWAAIEEGDVVQPGQVIGWFEQVGGE